MTELSDMSDLSKAAPIIQTNLLSRSYQRYEKEEGLLNSLRALWNRQTIEKVALYPTSLEIFQGEIVGLVGANGAGKTTLLKLLSGLIYPSSGSAKVLGFNPWERKNNFLRNISLLLGQKNQLWWDIAPLDSFRLLIEIYDLDYRKAYQKVDELAELLQCKTVLRVPLRRLSLGERMKMEIIGSLLHEPKVLFLDEPTIGLDIVAQTRIRKFLSDYVAKNRPTVLLTSHYMDDITKLADRLLLISQGKIVFNGTLDAFMKKTQIQQTILLTFDAPLEKDLPLMENIKLPKGEQEISIKISADMTPVVLEKIGTLIGTTKGLHKIKMEETDFEEVIHSYLESEHLGRNQFETEHKIKL